MTMQEKQMHDLWKMHPYMHIELETESGSLLRIIHPGQLNTDSGPDFFEGRIELDGQEWVGNIEMHIRSSDWIKHGHTSDEAYGNVILHVVLENDFPVKDIFGKTIPVLVLTESLLDLASERTEENRLMPVVSPGALELFGAARLSEKSKQFANELQHLKGDFESLFLRHLFRRFGMRTNSEPFQQLAHIVPHTMIRRQRAVIPDLEAILFGQSGLLPSIPTDGYSADLLFRYQLLANKYKLKPMNSLSWKFMRMRPANFPTIRISQLAALLHLNDHLYSRMITEESVEELQAILDVSASSYWNNHFRFGISSTDSIKTLGSAAVESILINAVASLRFFTGVTRDDQNLQNSALDLLRSLPPENNNLIRKSGITPLNALESQGILQMVCLQSKAEAFT